MSLDPNSPTVVVNVLADTPALNTSAATVTLQDAFAVSCLGCSSYSASVDSESGPSTAISNFTVTNPTPSGNPLIPVTGDIGFDIDITQVGSTLVENKSVTFTVTAN